MTRSGLLLAVLACCPALDCAADSSAAKEQLNALFKESWEFALAEDPLFATHAGDNRYNDKLPRETLTFPTIRGRATELA